MSLLLFGNKNSLELLQEDVNLSVAGTIIPIVNEARNLGLIRSNSDYVRKGWHSNSSQKAYMNL